MPTALVTGGTGFAGTHLIDQLLDAGEHVAAWGRPSGRALPADRFGGRVEWLAVDVTDREAVARALDRAAPSTVYHCAGIAAVQSAWADAARALRVNAYGTHVLLSELQRAGSRIPVLVTGSALVYRPSLEPLGEDSPIAPPNPYAVSKLAQELVAATTPGPHVVIARPFNHAGPGQSDDFVTSSFARQIAEAEAGLRDPVLRVGNLDARRDITDVRDTVRAYRLLTATGRARTPYNVCRGVAYRIADLLDLLLARARTRITIEHDPDRLRPSDNPVVLGNADRLRLETGWVPRIAIEQTLDDLLHFWRGVVSALGLHRP
jgi:GDP-4-dehydro-6-deoxy-D-mannose reductase